MTYDDMFLIDAVIRNGALVSRIAIIKDTILAGNHVIEPNERDIRQMHKDLSAAVAVLNQRAKQEMRRAA